ncbi:LAME_0D10880g1_1 [Lachancea meyersii CBS 8951]|uniref:LAME_0D10880g1_1 n=1 Tax=Lachancea meyersii CBS 8951 TaxID=1266667 RepID=A0A1G4JCL9_9SACH|nr:LAME_0D10880g1_1 [Lachancea meyersii CBS 8951]
MNEKLDLLQIMQERGHARELGHLENYFALCQRQDLYTNFSMYCELTDACTREELASAIRAVCLENPILLHTVIPRNENNHTLEYYASEEHISKPIVNHEYMQLLEKVELSDIIMNEQPEYASVVEEILEIFAAGHNKYTSDIFDIVSTIRVPYGDCGRPNWRILVLSDGSKKSFSKFLFISNHCSSDANSAANFFKDISSWLNKPGPHPASANLIFDYAADHERIGKLPIPIDERVDYKPPLSYLARLMGVNFVRKYLGYRSNGCVVSRITKPDEGNRVHSYFLNFTPDQVEQIRDKIKMRDPDCTMSPFLQTCWLVSMYKFGKVFSGSIWEWFIDMVVPMHTSQLLPEDSEIRNMYRYGSNIGGSRYNYLISSLNIGDDKEAFWSLVKYYNGVFRRGKCNNDYLYPLGALMLDVVRQKSNVDKLVVDDLVGLPREGVVLSNIGIVKQGPEIEKFKVHDLVFSQTLGSLRHSFTLSACTTTGSGMNLVMCGAHGTVKTKEDWVSLCELFKHEVLAY